MRCASSIHLFFRLSVRPSVNICTNHFFSKTNGWIATKLAHDGPRFACIQMCSRSRSRSKVMLYGHFCDFIKIASSCRQMAGLRCNSHTMVPRLVCINGCGQVKGHVIQALLWFHKKKQNCFFSQANGWIMTKLTHSLNSPSLSPFPFLLHPNPQMAMSSRCEFCHSWHYVLSLRAHTLWNTISPWHFLSRLSIRQLNLMSKC